VAAGYSGILYAEVTFKIVKFNLRRVPVLLCAGRRDYRHTSSLYVSPKNRRLVVPRVSQ